MNPPDELMFKPEDFFNPQLAGDDPQMHEAMSNFAASIANEILAERIEKLPKIMMNATFDKGWHECDWDECKHTHEARLLGVKKL